MKFPMVSHRKGFFVLFAALALVLIFGLGAPGAARGQAITNATMGPVACRIDGIPFGFPQGERLEFRPGQRFSWDTGINGWHWAILGPVEHRLKLEWVPIPNRPPLPSILLLPLPPIHGPGI